MTMRAKPAHAAWRGGLGWIFAVVSVLAHASQESLRPPAAEANERYRAVVNRLERMDTGGGMRVIRYDLSALVELDEKIKQKDIQAIVGKGSIAVLYPDLGEPYRSIFAKIIEGIEEKARVPVRNYPIGSNADVNELNAQLKRNGTKVVIALGRQGLKTATGLDRDFPVVVGGVVSVPEPHNRDLTGVSLTPDPALLFARLKNLMPNVRRVIVVYDPQHNDWLIKLARDAARAQGLELQTHEARDLASAARIYESAFSNADSRRDAVWLPQDSTTVDEGTILPLVLKESWNRGVPVFSSSYLHVKKGALFALYPNNLELGRTLASSALNVLAGDPGKRGVLPLREVHTAVNLRTASHIGLNIGYQQQRSFDSVFPEP
ncbi:MAG TPA: ABC transporter substrate binding protein [Paucimonas sp.]|nr:ABC transporter substrate binding protein [Paucimonas sp.]